MPISCTDETSKTLVNAPFSGGIVDLIMGPASIITFEEDTWNTFPDGDKTFEEDDDAATSAATP
jgi:hypothetical protein